MFDVSAGNTQIVRHAHPPTGRALEDFEVIVVVVGGDPSQTGVLLSLKNSQVEAGATFEKPHINVSKGD